MNIQVNSNAFTKLEKMVGISTVNIELLDYQLNDKILNGKISILGEYYSSDPQYEANNGLNTFENIIPFEIVFTKNDIILNNILIDNFEYYEVVGRGLESSFCIDVEYEVVQNEVKETKNSKEDDERILLTEEEEEPAIEEVETNENIKDIITEKIDDLLSSKLEVKTDNFLELPQNTENISRNDKKSTIKVIYYDKNEQVKELCKNYHCSYEEILKENKKYNFSDNYRLIISGNNEYK